MLSSNKIEFPTSPEAKLEAALVEGLHFPDEGGLDVTWSAVQEEVKVLALRPAKRLRPRLLLEGYQLAGGATPYPQDLWKFSAGLETLHTFLLIHDDVADHSDLRRGGPTLHLRLDRYGAGADLAMVAGTHLFARALELLMSTSLPRANQAALYYLRVCRHTAVGQFLDLRLATQPLSAVTASQALKVCLLKTAQYSFAAPLACGALLANDDMKLMKGLERIGRHLGVAFQLQDDLLGIFGGQAETGKPAAADLFERKRTFPIIRAYQRASVAEKALLDELDSRADQGIISRAREIICDRGGVEATQHQIRSSLGQVERLRKRSLGEGAPSAVPSVVDELMHQLLMSQMTKQ